jgi:hypothetical protein
VAKGLKVAARVLDILIQRRRDVEVEHGSLGGERRTIQSEAGIIDLLQADSLEGLSTNSFSLVRPMAIAAP